MFPRFRGRPLLENIGPSLHWSCLSPVSKHYSKEGSVGENENFLLKKRSGFYAFLTKKNIDKMRVKIWLSGLKT